MIDRVLACICEHPEGISDASICLILNAKHHQEINTYCRKLETQGFVARKGLYNTKLNFPTDSAIQNNATIHHESQHKRWNWENNVQSIVADHLNSLGYEIIPTANNDSKHNGRYIRATRENNELWICIKGFPVVSEKTDPSIQAKHWFTDAFFEVISWRGTNLEVDLAVALPYNDSYKNLSQNVEWLQKPANFSFIWVREDGSVEWTEIRQDVT